MVKKEQVNVSIAKQIITTFSKAMNSSHKSTMKQKKAPVLTDRGLRNRAQLSGFLNLAGTQAAGTNLDFACLTIHDSAHMHQVRQKTTFGRIMCVTDIVAAHRAFSTYFATFSHDNLQ